MTDAMLNFGDLKFIKLLVVSDKLERDRASKKFEQWARTLDRLTLSDARKLWKGLFYGMWSADKFPIQQQLSKRLASIILQFKNDELVLIYLEAFWDIITLEWSGIDRLRYARYRTIIVLNFNFFKIE